MRHESTLAIPADHPAFAGHFPGRPIVPGVVLLDEVLFAIRQALGVEPATCRIVAAKFFHPVGPGAILTLRFDTPAGEAIRFEVLEGARRIASGTLEMPSPAGPEPR